MISKKGINRLAIVVVIGVIVLAVCGVWFSMSVQASADDAERLDLEAFSQSATIESNDKPVLVSELDFLVQELSTEDMIKKSHLVIKGELTEISPAAWVDTENGGNSIYTNYVFRVKETYRGEVKDEVVLSQEGGQVGNRRTVCCGSPEFELGKEYVLYLYRPMPGYGLVTDDDYYWLVGYNQGVFAVEETAGTMMAVAEDGGEKTSLQTLAQEIEALDQEYPVNYNWEYEEMMENMKANLESGFITKEESEQMLAELYQYAKIVEE